MKSHQDEYIHETVVKILENVFLHPKEKLKLNDKIIEDLKMDSDDFSFLFVPMLEKATGIKVPVEKWAQVITIEDVIRLLEEYNKKKSNAE
ncbi:MAG: acyl carrier protein [Deltaproteobacteria bacterium]